MTKDLIEVNFDGIVGPTHHFGGLGVGNLASIQHRGLASNPKAAALQGIAKIKQVAQVADRERVRLAVLPPLMRPDIAWLRELGFSGDNATVLRQAGEQAPRLLYAAWSASSMWTANAATVSPSVDCGDSRVHLTVANLTSSIHRSLEPAETLANLCHIFGDDNFFSVHTNLPGGYFLRDEGAANHMRLCGASRERAGIEIFVHGQDTEESQQRFQPRQSEIACHSIARKHRLDKEATFFLTQNPMAIDAGAFHNDVVATSCENVLFYHQQAFVDAEDALLAIRNCYQEMFHDQLYLIRVDSGRVSLADAISSYLFNSVMIRNRKGSLTLISPAQCGEIESVRVELESILAGKNPISDVQFVDLRESMWNGGGPACLRLRVTVSSEEFAAIHPGVLWSDLLERKLTTCIDQHYRDRVVDADLTDVNFAVQAWEATRSIRAVLGLEQD